MRRALASLLLALFSFPLIVPMLRADAASSLPACCRRNGEHHCAMPDHSSGSALRASQPRCPLFPKAGAAAVSFNPVVLSAAPQAGEPSLVFSPATKSNHNIPQITLRGSVQKRGPPSSLD